PFHPPAPILGLVRQRDPRTHMSRLDMDRYRAFTDQPASPTDHPIVVVGAGLAGATAARLLADHGFDVVVLDKGRRVGGRSSRRRLDDVVITHGAAHLHAWPSWMEAWAEVERIEGRIVTGEGHRLVNGPDTIAGWLEGIDVLTSTTVTRIEQDGEVWNIHDEEGNRWQASGVVVTAPLPQLHRMMEHAPDAWSSHPYEATWTVVLAHQEPAPDGLAQALHELGMTTETGDEGQGLVVHLPADWSREHLEMERTDVLQAFIGLTEGLDGVHTSWLTGASSQAHRWRYGRSASPGVRANLPRLVEAGDAWGEPVGTGGAALHSGAWAAASIAWQCSQDLQPKPTAVQQTLF
ncbi:MAG: FAD-dependent oxidoreductase, partial [Candidatus Poseidonia sp.]|nr:FAD-dependent oxidoreductase [Poseidonia sp.]